MHEYVKFVPVYRNRHTGVSEHGKERFLGIISRILAHKTKTDRAIMFFILSSGCTH